MKKKAVILGFYVSAALANAALGLQYGFGGYISYTVLAILVFHFIFQILHGIEVQTVSTKYGIGLGVLATGGLVFVQVFYGLALRSYTKLYMVYLSLSRKHLDYTAIWPAKWYVVSAITIVLIFSATLFRIMHWPGAVEAAFVGYGIRSVFFIYIGYYKAFTSIESEDEVDEIGKGVD